MSHQDDERPPPTIRSGSRVGGWAQLLASVLASRLFSLCFQDVLIYSVLFLYDDMMHPDSTDQTGSSALPGVPSATAVVPNDEVMSQKRIELAQLLASLLDSAVLQIFVNS